MDILSYDFLAIATTVNVGVLAGLLVIFALIGVRSDKIRHLDPTKANTADIKEQFVFEVNALVALIILSSLALIVSIVAHLISLLWLMWFAVFCSMLCLIGVPVYVFIAKGWLLGDSTP